MHPCTTQLPACTRPHGVVSSAGRPRRQLPCHRGRPSPPALLPLATPKRAPVLPMLQTRLCSIKESGLRHTPNNGRQPSQRRQMRLCVTSLPKRTLNNNQRSLPLRHKIHLSHQNRTSIRKEASNAPHNAIPISTYRNFRTIPRHLPCRRKRIGRPGNLPPPTSWRRISSSISTTSSTIRLRSYLYPTGMNTPLHTTNAHSALLGNTV